MICFENDGEIDIRAIKTFGVSVKQAGAIGFFGTGLKYAIAILLREGQEIIIFSGEKKYKFTKKKIKVTGKDFDVVCMNGKELGFTTETGKTWKLWQALREIYCNCTDEHGQSFKASEPPSGKAGTTRIFVSGEAFENAFENIGQYILQGEPDISTDYCDIRLRPTHNIFYKGVMVKDDAPHAFATYNIKLNVELTEDRTLKFDFQAMRNIENAIISTNNRDFIQMALTADPRSLEGRLEYQYCHAAPSPEFLEVCKHLSETKAKDTNLNAVGYAKKFTKIKEDFEEFTPTKLQIQQVERAAELLGIAGYHVTKFPIVYVESLGAETYALAKNGTCYISRACFQKGTKFLAHALLEEFFHLEHGHKDETREFQTFLFDNILTLVERLNQEVF
jgi:hypothetical protein